MPKKNLDWTISVLRAIMHSTKKRGHSHGETIIQYNILYLKRTFLSTQNGIREHPETMRFSRGEGGSKEFPKKPRSLI